ncbi:E3 ubiquitin-protein ligase TRAIP-like protein [Turdus rufiventris]|nr:E3 ubiquitin-protein ligase TRAIP-like protein [Turdus rufiventris]
MPFGCVTLGDKKDYNQPSEVTDRYDLGQVIKTEEFCEIFRAKEKTTGKLYTCKKFLKRDGRKVRKAAKNEIIILKMVKHPNILQLVDVYITRKEYFIFLELATGREVFDWILDQGYYSEKDTSNVIRQVLEAVAYLHSLKIVHRNLKSLCQQLENLVYYNRLKNSKIVISDFHLAKLENGLIKEPCGTPEYLAPEVVGRQRYGRPVDCWAIGVIMYILLSGNPPFYEEADEDDYENHDKNLFRKILAGDYEFDPPYWDDISQAAKELVTRLMEVEQDQRITAEEAISHEWISGNAASDKNIKDGVCAQIEKNFARAKWKVSKKHIISKLFFDVTVEEQAAPDAESLQNELDKVKAQLSLKEKEKRECQTVVDRLRDTLDVRNATIESLQKMLGETEMLCSSLKKQMKFLEQQQEDNKSSKEEACRLRNKLRSMERIELLLQSQRSEVEEMIKEMGVGQAAVEQLAIYCVSLKKEYENLKEARKISGEMTEKLKKELFSVNNKLQKTTSELEKTKEELKSTQKDLKNADKEILSLKKKIDILQDTLKVPSVARETLSRLVFESPTPVELQHPKLHRPEHSDEINLDATYNVDTPEHQPCAAPFGPAKRKKLDKKPPPVVNLAKKVLKETVENRADDLEDDALEGLLPAFIRNSVFSKKSPSGGLLGTHKNMGSVSMTVQLVRTGYDGMGGRTKFIEPIAPLPSSTLCPICKTTELTSSPGQPNFNACTQCHSKVCNQCGFNPNPHLTQVKEWLCLNCQMQRALGMDMTTAPRSKSQQQLHSPSPSPSQSPAKHPQPPAADKTPPTPRPLPQEQPKPQPTTPQREPHGQGQPKPQEAARSSPQHQPRSSPQHQQAKPSPSEQRKTVGDAGAKPAAPAPGAGAPEQPQEGLTGKLFGFGASLLTQASTLMSAQPEAPAPSQPSPGKVPPKIVFSDASKEAGPKAPGAQGRAGAAPAAKPGKAEQGVKPKEVPKARVLCPLCKAEINVGSSDPPNYNTCTTCRQQVCNMCGFNPTPHLVELGSVPGAQMGARMAQSPFQGQEDEQSATLERLILQKVAEAILELTERDSDLAADFRICEDPWNKMRVKRGAADGEACGRAGKECSGNADNGM